MVLHLCNDLRGYPNVCGMLLNNICISEHYIRNVLF